MAAPKSNPLDEPPAGLAPTSTHLSEIIRSNTAAAGRLDVSVGTRTVEDWNFVDAGKPGTEHLERSGTDYHSVIVTDPFKEEYGQFSGVGWHKNQNGFTSRTSPGDDESFSPLDVLDDLADPKNDVSLAGATSDGANYVVKVTLPLHKHPEWVFVDEKTGLISRLQRIYSGRRYTRTYDDYRLDAGRREPWHVHTSDGRSELDDDWKRVSLTHPAAIDPAHFVPPPSSPSVAFGFATATQVPAEVIEGAFVVRLSVQGRGLDFLLDSGASHSIIDRGVAKELHLPEFGQTTALANGKSVGYSTIIDDATVGPVRLHRFAVDVRDFNYQASDNTRVVGTLGYDFLAGAVLHIDYDHGRLEFIPPAQFAKADPVAGGTAIPMDTDDGVPLVTVRVGTSIAQRMVIDTVSPYTVMFGQFVLANQDDFVDGKGHDHSFDAPFADDDNYGVEADVWLSKVSHMQFGLIDFRSYPLLATNATIYDGTDGMLGVSFLRFYDWYFDYANSRLIIKPNRAFHDTFRLQ